MSTPPSFSALAAAFCTDLDQLFTSVALLDPVAEERAAAQLDASAATLRHRLATAVANTPPSTELEIQQLSVKIANQEATLASLIGKLHSWRRTLAEHEAAAQAAIQARTSAPRDATTGAPKAALPTPATEAPAADVRMTEATSASGESSTSSSDEDEDEESESDVDIMDVDVQDLVDPVLLGTDESDVASLASQATGTASALEAALEEEDDEDESDDDINDLPREPILSPATAALFDQYVMMTSIDLIHPPRPGKKLLVLDLDHTLFDCKSTSLNPHDLLRPGTHEFLTTVYACFDLAIWSQSSRTLLNHKLATLGLLDTGSRAYRIAFTLDATAMFPVTPRSRSPSLERAESPTRPSRMHVKALALIWARFSETWTRATTVHVDDLSRNFVLNPRNGIRVDPWFWSADAAVADAELPTLARYLVHAVAPAEDVTTLDHRAWRQHRKVRCSREGDIHAVETLTEKDDSNAVETS
ncbi:Ubiquitin-like domain-containing CTD phosphatase 1 [Allomyces arbusculus]|nr:Ubiquitin-like domain-containing CTD phosphatase 1 [Allomyces arbusculus]